MKDNKYFLYYFFDNPFIRWLRVLAFFLIGFFVYLNISDTVLIIRVLPIYFVLILQEFFIHFKLEISFPKKKITEEYKHIIECVDYKTRVLLERHKMMNDVFEELSNLSEVKFLNRLLDIKIEKPTSDISENEVLDKVISVVSSLKGIYVHGVDIYVAYLLLLDEKEKVLFNNDLDEKDVLTVLSWVRKEYGLDSKIRHSLHFTGSGVFDFFVYGWSAQLSRYASNFTRDVLSHRIPKPIGRNQEYDLMITALSKNSSSNALLVGPAGVGKTALVTQFVEDSNAGNLPHPISNKMVFQLYAERLLAGINNKGDLEERFVELFSELAHAGNIIVYIPNIENIFGGGGLNVDISGVLVEYLKSSRIKIIGSTTDEAFKEFISTKVEIKELFDVVEVGEPDAETVLFMTLEKSKELEYLNKVKITFSAIKESVALSSSYTSDGIALPGRAIHLLDDAISFCLTHGTRKITKKDVQDFVEEKVHIVLDKPDAQESQKLLNLEQDLHKSIISQNEAVQAISDAMRRVRSGMKEGTRPIASFLFLGPTGVGKTQTAKALAKSYFGDEKSMIRLDMSEYQEPQSVERFLGREGSYGSTITDKVANNPFSLILLDEFEKAYPRILDLFLQILDEGHLTDDSGRTISFSNCIIIATSNAGSEFIREEYKEGMIEDVKKQLVEKILESNIFKPELINRFDDVIIFKSLNEMEVAEVAKLFLGNVIKNAEDQQVTLSYDESVPFFIAKSAYNIEFGARNIRRFIEQSIENQLSKLILSNKIVKGSSAKIKVVSDSLVIEV